MMEKREVGMPPTRPKIGLVLGAGGVLGCAHGGVIKVLDEASVPIDVVVGASIGAIVGLAVATRIPAEYMARSARETTSLDLLRFYAGRLRTTHANPISRRIFEAGAGKNFEDLEIPFAVVATNMETGQPEIINSGPVLPAIQASIALPLVARAVNINGSFYLDGGIRDDVPVWAARQMGAEGTIAVRLGPSYPASAGLGARLPHAIFRRLAQQAKPLRGSLGDQLRFGCRQLCGNFDPTDSSCEADVVIDPDFEGLGPNSMFGAAFCYWKGVEATRRALAQIERLVLMPAAPASSAPVLSGDAKLRADQVVRLGDLDTSPLKSFG
jgi:predicted acylesterase/phospholipase RssA